MYVSIDTAIRDTHIDINILQNLNQPLQIKYTILKKTRKLYFNKNKYFISVDTVSDSYICLNF